MRKIDFSKALKLSVIFVLIAAMALAVVSCGNNTDSETEAPKVSGVTTSSVSEATSESTDSDASSAITEGKYTLTVTVVDDKGESTDFEIKTNAENLGDALLEAGLVEGEDGPYGLYIKYVNGLRADYDLDKAYWSLTKDGEYMMTGADKTPIADGEHYELTYTK